MSRIRIDFIFSYWILGWFILYITKMVKTPPTILVYLGTLFNTYELLYLIYLRSPVYNLIKFFIILVLFKLIPLYFVWNHPITIYEIKATIIVVLLYFIWIYANGYTFESIYYKLLNGYSKGGHEKTIVSSFYDNVYNKLK